jgi:hypothetical protein
VSGNVEKCFETDIQTYMYHRNLVNYTLEATEENLAISPAEKSVHGSTFYKEYNLSLIVGNK